MAEVTAPARDGASASAAAPWTGANQRAQFAAITQLRWRIFRNSLRRKGGKGDLAAKIIMVPLFLAFAFLPAVGAGFAGYFAVANGHFEYIAAVLWGIFILAQLTSIQLGQANTVFDPTQLIRFPLNFRGYAVIRVFFGLLSPSNMIAVLTSLATAIGISVAAPEIALWAFLALFANALANIFFTRMAFSWVDRWLSTRRAREVFTGFIFAFSLGIQYVNFTMNPGFQHGQKQTAAMLARVAAARHFYAVAKPVLDNLPPGLVARALAAARVAQTPLALACIAGVLAFAALFFAVFALRLRKEFRGETLSDVANGVTSKESSASANTPAKPRGNIAATDSLAPASVAVPPRFAPPPTVAAVVGKEFLTLRRTSGVFYSIVAPLVMVVLFMTRFAARAPLYILFPAAVAYTLLGVLPLGYNTLGMEGAGIQFYFLAPVRMRDVMFAKNLLTMAMGFIEIAAVFITLAVTGRAPSPMMTLSVLFWAVFTVLISLAVGNYRSVVAPKKIDPQKAAGKQSSPLSALMSMGVLLVSAAIGASVILLARVLHAPWLLPPVMLLFAVIGVVVYRVALEGADKMFATHRDTISEALSKAT